VNGDLARNVRRRVNRRGADRAKGRWQVGRTGQKRERIGQDPRWRESVIERSSWLDRKVTRRSRDRGCNGHRILRRVLTEGRHPGLLEVSAVTGRRGRQAWQLPHHDHFVRTFNRTTNEASTRESDVRDVVNGKKRQGCQRLD
jgi:hypothetical protein